MDKHVEVLSDTYGITAAPLTPQIFGGAGKEHMEKYGMLLSIRFDHCLEHRTKFLSSSFPVIERKAEIYCQLGTGEFSCS